MKERTERNPKGAGRPSMRPEEKQPRKPSLSITGTPTELERLKKKAEDNFMTISKYVLSSLGCTDIQNK